MQRDRPRNDRAMEKADKGVKSPVENIFIGSRI